MQADQPGLGAIVEMAAHRVAYLLVELTHIGRLGKNRLSDRARRDAAFRGFLDDKDDFVHEIALN